jgi:hypothetical protein
VDGVLLVIWIIRLAFLALLYVFLYRIARALLRDLRSAARERVTALGRLIVVDSPSGEPAVGRSFDLDAVTAIGRDVNNAIVVDDPFASAEHAVLTYRGQSWYVEDLGSTNGTAVNGRTVAGLHAVAFGDEVGIGQVRFRLERSRAA